MTGIDDGESNILVQINQLNNLEQTDIFLEKNT